eukprot:SRR837773.3283.p1 GENE.SRR837773.3283~~SRR837773.3283.p1  ORF type:complete len:178 (+),score=18.50 SRR837773.3283:3-536(+)
MFTWLVSVICLPLAGSCCAGTSFAYGELGVGWIKLVKIFGGLVAVFEAFLVISNQADASGTVSIIFGALTSLISCFAVFARGSQQVGLWKMLAGNIARSIAFAVILFAPASCRTAGLARHGCPFSKDFNHNAVYHCCLIVSVSLIALGVFDKYSRDKELAYSAMMRTWAKSDRMCGC